MTDDFTLSFNSWRQQHLDVRGSKRFCEYATLQPDAIICSEKSAAVVNGTSAEDEDEIPNDMFGLIIEANGMNLY